MSPTGAPRTAFQKAASRGAPITLSAIRSYLSPNEAILEYILDDPQSFYLYVTHDRAGVTGLPTTRDALVRLVTAYRKGISTRLASPPSSAELYSVLLKPLSAAILKPSLVIVPDGQLNLIPFDALVDNTGEYVLSSHVVSYAPSATVLHLIRHTKKPNSAPIAFLGLGGVPYQGPTETLATNPETGHGTSAPMSNPFDPNAHTLPDLPSTVDEIKGTGDTFAKSNVLLLGADATEAAFKAEPLDQFRIIHLAAHAIATPRFPERAALVLGEDSAKQEGGLLQAREIRNLRLNADLVTLSACDTGTGRLQGEEGIASLERAFLYAGARSVLASLWSAHDVSAATLMAQFYRDLAAGPNEGEALREAKLDLLNKYRAQAAPFYWAGFTLVGDASIRLPP